MANHVVQEQMERYLARRLSPEEVVVVHDHLAACDACRRRLAEASLAADRLAALQADLRRSLAAAPEHPGPEPLADYLDGRADAADREIIEGHLAACAECRADLDDLRAFGQTMRLPGVQAARRLGHRSARSGLWQQAAWGLGLAAAALLLVFGALWTRLRPLHQELAGLRSEIKTLDEANRSLRERLARVEARPAEPAAGERVVLRDGDVRVALDASGHLTGLEGLPPDVRPAIADALTSQRVTVPAAIRELVGAPGVLMGGSSQEAPFRLVAPVGTAVVTDRPTFRWRPRQGTVHYRVVVFDESFREIAASERLSQTEWTARRPLARGRAYTWQVIAVLADGKEIISPTPPAPPAKMKVLEAEAAQALARASTAYGSSRLARGVLYAGAGALDEAEREFEALARDNPDAPVARNLLESLRATRRRPN